MSGRKSKINRNTMFYSEEDYNFDVELFDDYINNDINQTIILYQVDRGKTLKKNLYGEVESSRDITYKEPIELNVLYLVDSSTNKSYDAKNNTARFSQLGNLSFVILEKTLHDNQIELKYGDFVGVQISSDLQLYYEISNPGTANYDNKHTLFGYKQLARTVECVPVDESKFKGI